jgi:hypothetical protein
MSNFEWLWSLEQQFRPCDLLLANPLTFLSAHPMPQAVAALHPDHRVPELELVSILSPGRSSLKRRDVEIGYGAISVQSLKGNLSHELPLADEFAQVHVRNAPASGVGTRIRLLFGQPRRITAVGGLWQTLRVERVTQTVA